MRAEAPGGRAPAVAIRRGRGGEPWQRLALSWCKSASRGWRRRWTRAHEIEALEAALAAVRQLHNEVEARLGEAPRAELHANQGRRLGTRMAQQMPVRG